MSANFVSGAFVRVKAWHGLGIVLPDYLENSHDMLVAAGMDWKVKKVPVQLCGGVKIPDCYAIVRDTDKKILSGNKTVTGRYKEVQNEDCYAFLDYVIGKGAKYESAGVLNDGRTVWVLVKLENCVIGGDDTEMYLCITTTHDGSGSVKVCITPVRVVCENTLNLAFSTAERCYYIRHTTNFDTRWEDAKNALGLAAKYQVEFADYADYLIRKKISDNELKLALSRLFDPEGEKPSDLKKRNAEECKQAFYICYAAPDIAKFQGTAWGAINAMSDLVNHSLPHRNTKEYAENNWGRIMDGHPLLDAMVNYIG